jgi:hypothetical protein
MSFVFRRLGFAAVAVLAACTAKQPETQPTPDPDPRVGLKAGLMNAGEAVSNLRILAKAVSPPGFAGITNSDLAFTGKYAIQGNYNGPVIWDMSNPSSPVMVTAYTCPASQNDVSVYKNLLFMSAEANNGRVDCKPGGVADTVSKERIRGVRIFDISDIRNPKLVANVQTCRGSHTHTVLESPTDRDNVYIYVSGSAGIRSPNELAGCVRDTPDKDAGSSLMRIEIIKVPLARPEQAAVVNRANIFSGLKATGTHAAAPEDVAAAKRFADSVRTAGGFVVKNPNTGNDQVLGSFFVKPQLDSMVKARGGTGNPTAADTAAFRANMQTIYNKMIAAQGPALVPGVSAISPFRQCHDITVYPSLGLAGGACEGHGFLLDIADPVNPVRLDAVSDSNFAYWYNGQIVSSEIARGLDVAELVPSQYVSQNEIDAAKTVQWDYLNTQGQPKIVWPPSFALAKAYVDQLERGKCLSPARVAAVRGDIASAEKATGPARHDALTKLASQLQGEQASCDQPKLQKLSQALTNLSNNPVP